MAKDKKPSTGRQVSVWLQGSEVRLVDRAAKQVAVKRSRYAALAVVAQARADLAKK